MVRGYAYLLKQRCIDREILNAFVRKKLIYESCEKSRDGTKEYHNAVFVGFDEHGVPRHGHKRGLYILSPQKAVYISNLSTCCKRVPHGTIKTAMELSAIDFTDKAGATISIG